MRIYDSSNIRNIGILGHSGSGKSNMVEGLEFTAGLTNRIVGNENDTKITSSLSLHAVEYQGAKYNFVIFLDMEIFLEKLNQDLRQLMGQLLLLMELQI